MLQNNQKIIRHKVGLLNLAEELGNVSKACQMMRDARFAPEMGAHREAVFLPVEISRHDLTDEPIAPDAVSPAGGPAGGLIRIELAGGHRISVRPVNPPLIFDAYR